ncbi:MAG TPA: pyrroloquinoline quinone biosynthesis peptide chaperone PqqD [Gemmatimonadales bacterium]|nr:pyrroloquinoline quinone biosynthesis peptide chaperone PqqD [Gemmatimonadales bacterium]
MALAFDAVPRLWKVARVEYDSVRQKPVLLYPEGAVFLNDTGAAVLKLVDGKRTVGDIAAELSARYHEDVSADVAEYLETLVKGELVFL